MSDPRLTAYEGFPDGVSDSFCRHAATATSQYGTTARALAAEVLAYRADVERLTAERDALKAELAGAMQHIQDQQGTVEGIRKLERELAKARAEIAQWTNWAKMHQAGIARNVSLL